MRAFHSLALFPALGLLVYGCGIAQAQPEVMNYEAVRRTVAPRIDGVKAPVAWKSAAENEFAPKPEDKQSFNPVRSDRLGFTSDQTEAGGEFVVDTNRAARRGVIELARDVAQEAPAPAPAWLASLFPNTGAPDHLTKRLRRLEARDLEITGKVGGLVTVELSYPGLDGKALTGQARIYLPPTLREAPNQPVPLIHNAGYELDERGARSLLAKGYAVSTPHAEPVHPLVRGANFDRAILHAVETLPFVDRRRVAIQGGSAGGWMTLLLTADTFPVIWSAPSVPVVHWSYNANYFVEQRSATLPPAGSQSSPLPLLSQVAPIVDPVQAAFGMPFTSRTFLAQSPLAHLDTITSPIQMTCSPADLLVPIDQISRDLVLPKDPKSFPAGFSTEMTARAPAVKGKRTLLTALDKKDFEVFHVTPPDGLALNKPGVAPPLLRPKTLEVPFSRERRWSVVVLDEGPAEPWVGHLKYVWPLDTTPFQRWAEQRGIQPRQLTRTKLERLMKRCLGKPWLPYKVRPNNQGNPITAEQLDWPEAEREDVRLGLVAYAADDQSAERLGRLYDSLPANLKAFGASLGDGTTASLRSALASNTPSK